MIHVEVVLHMMAAHPGRPLSTAAEQRSQSEAGQAGRIVIVEDNYFVGLTIEQALLDAGHDVLAVLPTGEEAVRESTRLRPDLVLMDIRLAGPMTGIEAGIALRTEGIPCLFASAHSDADTRASGEQAKPAGWLSKPFSASEITSAVAAALSQAKGH